MTWYPPVPCQVIDATGSVWAVQRAWPGTPPGSYVMEVSSPDRRGVMAGHFNGGSFEAVRVDDHGLPALAAESSGGEIVVHRAHRRAVLRAPEAYIKVFRPGRALAAAASHRVSAAALSAGGFDTPRLLRTGPDVLVLSRLAGHSFFELGQTHPATGDASGIPGHASCFTDASYAAMWARWSRAWSGSVTAAGSPAFQDSLQQLPLRDAAKEAGNLRGWVDHWLRHSEGIAAAAPARTALLARAEAVSETLLRTPPDPVGWAHGDLHDKQILGSTNPRGPGLLDFDDACRAEAALDLANLDVHLELRWQQHRLTTRRYALAHAAVLAAATRLGVSPHRFAAYAASTRLRLACLYSFRPAWAAYAADYLVSGLPGPTSGRARTNTDRSLT